MLWKEEGLRKEEGLWMREGLGREEVCLDRIMARVNRYHISREGVGLDERADNLYFESSAWKM